MSSGKPTPKAAEAITALAALAALRARLDRDARWIEKATVLLGLVGESEVDPVQLRAMCREHVRARPSE